ncbi:MAG: nucleotidyltransferase substrate binding protein [Ignavibacteriales bacterium]|nr:nucleotidyltransferase substrate binding protein [Ignavibacteriales bacterium]
MQFERAFARLKEVLAVPENDIVRDSAIQRFEFTLDLPWKMIKALLETRHGISCNSTKDCFREAYRQGLLSYDDAWVKLVDLRNETAHTYNEETAERIYKELPNALKHFAVLLAAAKGK